MNAQGGATKVLGSARSRMPSFLLAFFASLFAATALTPVARLLALRLGAVSNPGGRHLNARTIPRLGGLALSLGWCIPLALLFALHRPALRALEGNEAKLLAVVVGGLAMCAVGAFDDLRGVRAIHKLGAQLVVGAFAYWLGFRIEAIALPLVGNLSMGVFALPVTLLWIVGITNAVNLIDGLDGLAAGVTFFAALTSFIVAVLSGSTFVALLMAGLMGAVVGFLFFNFNPARIFMGDSGSYFLGYVLATVSLAGSVQQKASTAVSLLVPVIALGLPIFDTLFSMVRRFLERRPIFSPDRGHVHHRLLELGLTHRRAVILLYGVSIVLAGGAIGVSLGRSLEVGVALFSVSAVFVALVRFLGYFQVLHGRRRQSSRLYDEQTERLRWAVPQIVERLADASNEQDLHEILASVPAACLASGVGLWTLDGAVVRQWSQDGVTRGTRSTFPIGRDVLARAVLCFEWPNDREEPSPQGDILLQLLVDAVARALDRVGSSLAPATIQLTEANTDRARITVPTALVP
jgi:UDP-GlcNAc:undecaprenyl-phosphate/decaprenyl-phosphate GlcNAc-1-phosphate transferase